MTHLTNQISEPGRICACRKTAASFRLSVSGMFQALLLPAFLFPGWIRAQDTPIRLAVLPEDATTESRSLADLLTVRLSQTDSIDGTPIMIRDWPTGE